MFGDIIFEQGNYQEILLADEEQARLVLCVEGTSIKLFRIEWTDEEYGSPLNSAQYTLLDAIRAFREAVELQKEEKEITPMADKLDWNTRQEVARQIVDQMRQQTDKEQVDFIVKMLEHTDPLFVIALNFAYGMTPNQKRGTRAETPYTCSECGKSLAFPQTLFYQDKPYCFDHIPEYTKDAEGW